jgi:hypothetical protein
VIGQKSRDRGDAKVRMLFSGPFEVSTVKLNIHEFVSNNHDNPTNGHIRKFAPDVLRNIKPHIDGTETYKNGFVPFHVASKVLLTAVRQRKKIK